jgi:hypothetical protein
MKIRKDLVDSLDHSCPGDRLSITFRSTFTDKAAAYLLECEFFRLEAVNTEFLKKIVSMGYNYKQTFVLQFFLKEDMSTWHPFLYTLQSFIVRIDIGKAEKAKKTKPRKRKKI